MVTFVVLVWSSWFCWRHIFTFPLFSISFDYLIKSCFAFHRFRCRKMQSWKNMSLKTEILRHILLCGFKLGSKVAKAAPRLERFQWINWLLKSDLSDFRPERTSPEVGLDKVHLEEPIKQNPHRNLPGACTQVLSVLWNDTVHHLHNPDVETQQVGLSCNVRGKQGPMVEHLFAIVIALQ